MRISFAVRENRAMVGPMRFVAVVVMVVVGLVAVAGAEAFGGWEYTAPKGFTATKERDHLTFRKVTEPTFCSVTLFQARAATGTATDEAATEWKTVVETNFKASETKTRPPKQSKKKKLAYRPTQAVLTDEEGNQFVAIHYVVSPRGAAASVLLMTTDASSLKKCEPVGTALVDSLAFDAGVLTPSDPEARPPSVVGRFASNTVGAGGGYARREYTFADDGTYRFYSEAWGGSPRSKDWTIVDERGGYTVAGNQLALAPKTSTTATRDEEKVKSTQKRTLEKVTYTWTKNYAEGTNEWQLVLTPPKKTARDGDLAGTAAYVYSEALKPEWKFPPP